MAYADPFDVTTPVGTEGLSNGDDRIRELKRGLDQRLGGFFTGWPNTDPLTVAAGKVAGAVATANNALKGQTLGGTIAGVANGAVNNLFNVTTGGDAIYLVTCKDAGAGSGLVTSHAIVTYSASTGVININQLIAGTQLPLNYTAGTTITVQNTTGATRDINWNAFRLF